MAKNNTEEDPNSTIENEFSCQIQNGVTLCSHSSKRKRLLKPKIVKENDCPQDVESLLKSDSCVNGKKKTHVKPCRRSERKIIPSSLWDNAVINPFFERKRRKVTEFPPKTKEIPESHTNGHDKEPGHESQTSETLEDDPTSESETCDTSICHGHIRLRRSSRKLSSSVSSICDSKIGLKCSSQPTENGICQNGEIRPDENEQTVDNPEYVNGLEENGKMGDEVKSEDDHVSGRESTHKAVDNEIEIKEEIASKSDNEKFNKVGDDLTVNKEPLRRRRGRPARRSSAPASPTSESKGSHSETKTDGSSEPELTFSKDEITSKEALQLIDGSSFHRFYKMRTRRQNSSSDQGLYLLTIC